MPRIEIEEVRDIDVCARCADNAILTEGMPASELDDSLSGDIGSIDVEHPPYAEGQHTTSCHICGRKLTITDD